MPPWPLTCRTSNVRSCAISAPRVGARQRSGSTGRRSRSSSRWLASEGRAASLEELNREAIREWLAVLTDDHEPGTVKVRYRGLFRFCSWLVDEGELDEHPMATLSPPTLRMKPVPVINDDELAALLKACAGKEFKDRGDEALIRFLLDCGVRISEVCGLRVDQLDLDQGLAIVKGKGSKVRPVYFGARTARGPRPLRPGAGQASLGPSRRPVPHPARRALSRRRAGPRQGPGGHGRYRRSPPAPVPAHLRARLPDERRAGA
jgi:integrase